ncbi:hypothetical protein BLNAU_17653 [Blattamonas nauphoetae]|uniref:Auxin efflux carrier n=1 Tax=Blattamonas nauphoetae TaxID=2049346 RepID=A0ABQ9X6S4_9EUKA|nr:hypothetical protein BLNAU_17653 [Blattamonas nauphoetae]
MANIYWDVTQSVLIPAISMFLIGWLLGTTNLMKLSYVEALNKYTLYLGIPFAIFTILTAEWFPADQLLFLIPYTLHKIVMILIFFLPLLCFKKYRKELAVMFQLNANYSNNVIYGNALLMALYPLHRMDLLCVLSAIPDVTIVFSTSLFMLETAKAQERAEKDPSRSTSKLSAKDTCKLLPGVLLRVVSNPLIWLTVLGLIFNFCHITKPIWLRNATDFISRSNYATAMINIGCSCPRYQN